MLFSNANFLCFCRAISVVFGVVVAVGDAVATCSPGQYKRCAKNEGTCQCQCVSCPTGQTSNGNGEYYVDCALTDPHGSTGCRVACSGYDDTCPSGVGSGKKCKACANGCSGYAVCDVISEAVTYSGSGNCHIEGSNCYSNTRSCNEFIIDHWAIGWNCGQDAPQVGTATWNSSRSAWDTINCSCVVSDRNITAEGYGQAASDVHCRKANAKFYVKEAHRYDTKTVEDAVRYDFEWEFCRQCQPGYLPTIVSSPIDGIDLTPVHNSSWGVYKCVEVVSAPYYTDSNHDIDFTAPTGQAAINLYRQSCPFGEQITEDGATSSNDCSINTSQKYQDDMGTFTLSGASCGV